MNTNLYSAFDSVAEVFHRPFTEVNDKTAIRAFSSSLEDNKNKNDYTLYKIGTFDDNNGNIEKTKTPIKILTGFEIKTVSSISPEQNLKDLQTHLQQNGQK